MNVRAEVKRVEEEEERRSNGDWGLGGDEAGRQACSCDQSVVDRVHLNDW